MERIKRIWNFMMFDTYGNLAMVSFILCAISGIVLAIPYDVDRAYDSISLMLIANPAAVFFRNMHYWSAQFFLIFSILHVWDYLRLRTTNTVGTGIWSRLTASLFFIFFVMLTGFILKADVDGLQARQIFKSLLEALPLGGGFLSDIILGDDQGLHLIYIHHAATATFVLLIVIIEHSRIIWARKNTFLMILAVLSLLSLFIQAPFQYGDAELIKGPWYFVGLQEMLHYTAHPGWVWGVLALVLFLFWILNAAKERFYKLITKILAGIAIVYIVFTLIGFYFRGENWQWQWPWDENQGSHLFPFETGIKNPNTDYQSLTAQDIPLVQEKREACMICHSDVSGFSPAHDPQAIGCTSCHAGHPFSLNKERAHQGMKAIPGNLSDAAQSCGTAQCHPGIPERVDQSLMTTNSGIVSVDRFVFGENNSPDDRAHIAEIGQDAADMHLRNLCSKCHLGSEKKETAPLSELSRGGGCLACHLNYSDEARIQLDAYIASAKTKNTLPSVHPSLDLNISNDHCFGCHSRSGRISTNYEGWHETLLDENDVGGKSGYRVLQDQRVFEYVSDDVHHAAGMECIDCHTSFEVMGNGSSYVHEEQAVSIQCADCHFEGEGQRATYDELNAEEQKIYSLRKFAHTDRAMIRKKESGEVLINTYINKEHFLLSKNTDSLHTMKAPAAICTGNQAHESLSCSACHTAWAPQCIGCHNSYNPNVAGYDLLEMKERTGSWEEYVGSFFAEAPTLGVREGEPKAIIPAVPGMILTIDKNSFPEEKNSAREDSALLFHRLFAPAAPHTISKQGRNCMSCHNNPLALGYGRGKLVYKTDNGKGKWSFIPQYANNKLDGLPEDAWIGFLQEPRTDLPLSTRSNFRPFTLQEQQGILTIGACLTCHDENSEIMERILSLPKQEWLKQLSDSCILPDFPN